MRLIALYLSNLVLGLILLWIPTADSVIESVLSVVMKPQHSPRVLIVRVGLHVDLGRAQLVFQQSTSAL